MEQVVIIECSVQQRLQQCFDVLFPDGRKRALSGDEVRREWLDFVVATVDHGGWQAFWKVGRLACRDLAIDFPTVLLVYVERVDDDTATADVKVLGMQEDLNIDEEQHEVPLTQLWPTRDQDDSIALNLSATAAAIDSYRFFFNHVWRPWDQDSDRLDWSTFRERIYLFESVKTGSLPRPMAENMRRLLDEAKQLEAQRQRCTARSFSDDADGSVDLLDLSANHSLHEDVSQLAELHLRLMQIKCQMDILENPVMRSVMLDKMKDQTAATYGDQATEAKGNLWLVLAPRMALSRVAEDVARAVKAAGGDGGAAAVVRTSSDLQACLEAMQSSDVVLLSAGSHTVTSAGMLEEGGTLRGLSGPEDTCITTANCSVLFSFTAFRLVSLENLRLSSQEAQQILVLRRGKVCLKNCTLEGVRQVCREAIVVLPNCQLEMVDCTVNRFNTGIVLTAGATATLHGVQLKHMCVGIMVHEGAKLDASRCHFVDCTQHAVLYESEQLALQRVSSDNLTDLNQINGISLNESTTDSGKATAVQRKKLFPVKDLDSSVLNATKA